MRTSFLCKEKKQKKQYRLLIFVLFLYSFSGIKKGLYFTIKSHLIPSSAAFLIMFSKFRKFLVISKCHNEGDGDRYGHLQKTIQNHGAIYIQFLLKQRIDFFRNLTTVVTVF